MKTPCLCSSVVHFLTPMLKFRFLLIGLLAALVMRGQVDSFRVEGRSFRFHIPSGWIVEQNSNGIKEQDYWNVVIRHQLNEPKFHGNLAIKVEKRPMNTNTGFVSPKHTLITSGLAKTANSTIGYINLEQPKNKCNNCRKSYTDIEVYYLNEDLDLVVAFSGYGKKRMIDSLRKFFSPFQDNFFSENHAVLKSFRPLVQQGNNRRDSVFIGRKNYLITYDSGWTYVNRKDPLDTQTPIFVLSSITPGGRHVSLFIDPIQTGEGPAPSTNDRPSKMMHTRIAPSASEIKKDPLARGKPQNVMMRQDTAHFGDQKLFGKMVIPDHYYPTSIVYLVSSTDSSLAGFTMAFTICSNEPVDDLLKQYYSELLEEYITIWLRENHINATSTFYGMSPKAPSVPLQPGPPSTKKTKVE